MCTCLSGHSPAKSSDSLLMFLHDGGRGAGKVGNQLTVRQGLSTGIRPEGSDTATTSDFRFLISDF